MTKKRQKVLSDHKRQGKTLIPPFIHLLGRELKEISWTKTILPEILWIALIQYKHGHKRGVELLTSLTRAARNTSSSRSRTLFACASSYSSLTHLERTRLRGALKDEEIAAIRISLEDLVAWYPECPLAFLFSDSVLNPTKNGLQQLKEVVLSLYHRENRDPMMIQATVVWFAFDADLLKVNKGLALERFPEIEKYPHTELSRKIGSGIRSAVNMFFESEAHYSKSHPWPRYFWNRGLAIEACEFSHD